MSLVPPFLLLDRYEVTDEIGHGGHAVVYRAHDRLLDREVAVKLLRDDSLAPDTIARFRQEVQVTAQLEHAHILHVYDTGAYEGRPYIVMELASGRTLAERLAREGQLPLADALQIARDVGLALAHAHARGVVHRDVKPENILMGDGGAILADFGIARVTQDILTQIITSTGTTVGTVQYMSPEQLCAEPNIDARTDQYSLACVLYEMLAGVRPHIAATFEGLRLLRMTGQHVPVSAHRPSVPDYVDDAITTALAPMPADRFRTMEEMLAAIGVEASGEWQIGRSSDANRRSGGYGAIRASAGNRSADKHRRSASPGVLHESRRSGWIVPVVAAVLLATAAVAIKAFRGREGNDRRPGTISVFLAGETGGDSASIQSRVRRALQQELGQWPDVRLADGVRDGDSTSIGLSVLTNAVADSVRVQLEIRSGSSGVLLPASVLVSLDALSDPRQLAASLIREALVRTQSSSGLSSANTPGIEALPSRTLASLRAYVRGFEALREGHLDSATLRFSEAAKEAKDFAHADYWSAQSAAWMSPTEPRLWRDAALRAHGSHSIRGVDSLLAAALAQLADGAYPLSCATYRAATRLSQSSFVAWFGLGECQRVDSAVVKDVHGLSFRSSHWSALDAYRRAIGHAPTAELLSALFAPILKLTYAIGNQARTGRLIDGVSAEYWALPALSGDSIALTPIPAAEFFQGTSERAVPRTWVAAQRRGRAIAVQIASAWVAESPHSSSAWFAFATALELAGNLAASDGRPSASASLDSAERRHPDARLVARIGVARTRIALRMGDVGRAVALARTTLSQSNARDIQIDGVVAPLAAFVGDLPRAMRLTPVDQTAGASLPPALVDSLRAFNVRAQLGACDRLNESHVRLDSLFRERIPATDVESQRIRWLRPAVRVAVPCIGATALREFGVEWPLDAAVLALAQSDYPRAQQLVIDLQARRASATIAMVTWDQIFAESWILAKSGGSDLARRNLVSALDDIASMSIFTLDEVAQASSLRRGILLLRELSDPQTSSSAERSWVNRAGEFSSTRSGGY